MLWQWALRFANLAALLIPLDCRKSARDSLAKMKIPYLQTIFFALVLVTGPSHADTTLAALDDLLPPVQTETERFPPAEDEDAEGENVEDEAEEEPEPQLEPVKPEIEAPEEPLRSSLPTAKPPIFSNRFKNCVTPWMEGNMP